MPCPSDPETTRSRRAGAPAPLVLAVLLVAGCAAGPGGSPAASGEAGPSALPTAAVTPAAPVPADSPGATDPAPDGPPTAAISSPAGDAMAGELGSYTWAGTGSDAPWLVPPRAEAVTAAGPYPVALDPPLPVDAWTARWAPIADGSAGAPSAFEEGTVAPVVLDGPPGPGAWSLQLDVRFAGGGRAAWYWRVDPAP